MYNAIPEFPVYALPPDIRNAVWEVQKNTGAPVGLIVSSALASMSLAMQGLANVKRLDGLESPVTLWFLSVAESGERKTAVDSKFFSVFREFEADQAVLYNKRMSEYEADMADYKVEEKLILNAMKKGRNHNE